MPGFVSRIIALVVDEAHCIAKSGGMSFIEPTLRLLIFPHSYQLVLLSWL